MPEEVLQIPIYPPVEGLDKYTSPHEMPTTRSPNLRNFVCYPTYVVTRSGFSKVGLNLPLCISSKGDILDYKDAKGVSHLIALTDRFAYEYQGADSLWTSISGTTEPLSEIDINATVVIHFNSGSTAPIVDEIITGATSGHTAVVSSVVVDSGTWGGTDAAGSIYVHTSSDFMHNGENLDGATAGANFATTTAAANTLWVAGANVTLTKDTAVYKVGTTSVKLVAGAGLAADAVLATYTDNVSITGKLNAVSFYFRTTQENFQLKIKLYNGATGVTFSQTLDSVVPNTWYYVICYSATPANAAMTKLEVLAASAMTSGSTVYIDDINASEFLPFVGDRWAFCTGHDEGLTGNSGSGLFITNESYATDDANIKVYEGDSGDYFVNFSTDIVAAKDIIEFWNHLCAANYTTSTSGPFKVRNLKFSNLADLNDFTNGTQSVRILTDLVGPITRLVKLGYVAFVFATDSIGSMQYVGGNSVYSTPTETSELGLFACKALAVIQNTCFFLGSNKTIQTISQSNVSSIGQTVEDFLFNDLDFSNKEKTVMFIDTIEKRLYIIYPTFDNTNGRYIAFDYRTSKGFEAGEFHKTIISGCLAAITTSYYCDGPTFFGVLCSGLSGAYCDGYSSTVGKRFPMLLDILGNVYSMDGTKYTDDATTIDNCIIETPDITREGGKYLDRFLRVRLKLKAEITGAAVNVYYSYDDYIDDVSLEDTIWTAFLDSPITVTEIWKVFELPLDIRARRIRIKISCNATNKVYYLGGMVELVPGSTR